MGLHVKKVIKTAPLLSPNVAATDHERYLYNIKRPLFPLACNKLDVPIEPYHPTNVADILVVASFGKLLPKSYLDNFGLCVNVHPSALPKCRFRQLRRSLTMAQLSTNRTRFRF